MKRIALLAAAIALTFGTAPTLPAQQAPHIKENPAMHQTDGTFEVKLQPVDPSPLSGLVLMRLEKHFQGGLQGSSTGGMLSSGDPKAGEAGYVAMEVFKGTLDGKSGSFTLQHSATMDAGAHTMRIEVTPGSATGELKGLRGSLAITIEAGKHSYQLEYTLSSV